MCGIHAVISLRPSEPLSESLKDRLCSRGPDHLGSVSTQLSNAFLTLTSTVLALRGDHIAKQPLIDEGTGSILCWNGEAWRLGDEKLAVNDTDAVFELLVRTTRDHVVDGATDHVLKALRTIEGPFAFVFFDRLNGRVYFGRDRLGRRSLLVSNTDGGLSLSSIAGTSSDEWSEVEADGFYYVSLDEINIEGGWVAKKLAWTEKEDLVSSR